MSILLESSLVAVTGMVLAFAANSVSPRGLTLSRNYFPAPRQGASSGGEVANSNTQAGQTNALSAQETVASQLRQEGLGLADSNRAKTFFSDSRYAQGLIIFIDARDDEHYQRGHIPGAYQLDYYHPGSYLATVLPVCQTAEQIVVYCNGGDCEDSKHTAIFLRDAGVPASKLFVYAGGISEWMTNGLPVEIGSRKDGSSTPK